MKKTPHISIIIVNTNDKKYITNCLRSLTKQTGQLKLEIWVVDNGSTDGSVEYITRVFPGVKIIKNTRNTLYTSANNQGLKMVRSPYFLILNPDTRLPKTALLQMYQYMKRHSNIGLLACQQINGSGKILPICHRFFTPLAQMLMLPIFNNFAKKGKILQTAFYADWDRRTSREIEAMPGSCIFGRSLLLRKVGLLDEGLAMFHSDDDYCLRVKKVGYKLWYCADITITHLTSQTITRLPQGRVAIYGYADMTAYFKKHFGIFWFVVFYILTHVSILVSMTYSRVFISKHHPRNV